MRTKFSILLSALLAMMSSPSISTAQISSDWQTVYEKSSGVSPGQAGEGGCLLRSAPPPQAAAILKVIQWGVSPQGRPLIALVLSSERCFTPRAASRSEKPLVIINNGIHSGEIEGKDADLILARDILITHKHASLLDRVKHPHHTGLQCGCA